MSKVNLAGVYDLHAANLKAKGHDLALVIGTRQKPTELKPKHYLLLKRTTGGFEYISGMFPLSDSGEAYSIDYSGQIYRMEFIRDRGIVDIQAKGGKST